MDKLSILGILVSLTGIVGGQILEGGSAMMLVQGTAFVIVCGGTLGAVMLQFPFKIFWTGIRMSLWAFFPPKVDMVELIEQIVAWSSKARKDGLLSLEPYVEEIKDPFIQRGLQMLVDGHSAEKVREALDVEIHAYDQLHWPAARLWESAAGYSPTIGILGAVLGLIHVMQNLGEPSKLGAGIAVAFVATIYGVGLANLLYLPIANKLKLNIQRQTEFREMLIDGLMMIANGENPRFVESKLNGYLA